MDRQQVAKEIVDLVKGVMVVGSEDEVVVAEDVAKEERSDWRVRADLAEAMVISASMDDVRTREAAGEEREVVNSLAGLAPVQLRSHIDRIVEVRQELQQLTSQYDAVVAKLRDLEAEEKKGIKLLKDAAKETKLKGRYLAEAENGLLEFTAFVRGSAPGIAQLIWDPKKHKTGEKAGALIQRVAERLGEQVAASVEEIYAECVEDLTEMNNVISGLRVVAKTASVREAVLKEAALSDKILAVKDWLAGALDSAVKKVLGVAANIVRWVRGFAERTKLVKANRDKLIGSLDEARGEIEALLA